MKVFFIVMLVLIILSVLPITLRGKLDYILSENKGAMCIYFFRLKVFIATIFIQNNKIVIVTKRKRRELSLKSIREAKDFKSKFIKNLLIYLRYNNLRVLSSIGVNNAMYSALACGGLDIATGSAMTFISNRLKINHYSFAFMPSFLSFGAVLALSSSITFNLSLIIYIFFISL